MKTYDKEGEVRLKEGRGIINIKCIHQNDQHDCADYSKTI